MANQLVKNIKCLVQQLEFDPLEGINWRSDHLEAVDLSFFILGLNTLSIPGFERLYFSHLSFILYQMVPRLWINTEMIPPCRMPRQTNQNLPRVICLNEKSLKIK
jgi:hypothetical protein